MESSIAVFLERQSACELLPTDSEVKEEYNFCTDTELAFLTKALQKPCESLVKALTRNLITLGISGTCKKGIGFRTC